MSGADDEIVVALTAQTEQFNEKMEQAGVSTSSMAAQASAAINQLNTSITAQGEALLRLDAAFQGSIASAKGMQEAELALDQAMATGAITAEQQAAYLEQLNAVEGVAAVSARATATAVAEQTAALRINGGVAREVGVMIGEVMRGNYTRLEGSTITLANRSGYLATAFQFLTSPAGLVAAAIAAIGVVAIEAMDDINNLQRAIISTGGASGNSVEQLREMEQALQQNGATARQARIAVTDVAESGKLLGSSFQDAASAAISMSELTGQSIEQCVKEISRLADDPVKVLKELNERFHFLTPEEAEQVKHLQDVGDTAGATAKAVSLLNGALLQYNQQLSQSGAGAQSFKERTEAAFSGAWETVKGLFQPRTLQSQLDTINDMLTAYGNRYKGSLTNGLNGSLNFNPNAQGLDKDDAQTINRLLQERQDLQAKIASDQQRQTQASQAEVANQKAVNDILGASGQTKNLEDELHKQEAAQQISYDKRASFEADYWQKVFETSVNGSAQQAEAWEHMQSAQRELDNSELEAWRRTQTAKTEAARKAVQDVLNTFELERSEAQAGSAQRIAIDAQLMDRLERLEGENSQHYREALNQRLQDTRAFVQEAVRANRERLAQEQRQLQDGNRLDNQKLDNEKRALQQQYQDGEINASQLLALEQRLAQERLQINMAYYAAKERLDKGDSKAEQDDEAKVAQEAQKYMAEMYGYSKDYSKNIDKEWKSAADRIVGSFQTAFNSVLFQGQTLKQGLASVAETIAETFIQKAVQNTVQKWIEGEAQKLAAAISTMTGISTATETQAAADMATDKAKAASFIASAVGIAGAQGVASFSGAPWPIDMGAPAFGASMAAAAAGLGSVASAAGGWDRVPYDDAPALLHRNEMVLPANLADRVRGMTDGGGESSGGDTHYHTWNIQAMDGRSFEQFLRRGGMNTLGKVASSATKNSAVTRM